MSWWNLLGKGDTISKGIDLIDNSFYTDQEKAEQKSKLLDDFRPFKLTQRTLAKYVMIMFTSLFFIEVALGIIGKWYPEAWEVVSVINSLEVVQTMGWSYLAVISLYFTGGVVNSFVKKK